jgi:transposase InsO family protein
VSFIDDFFRTTWVYLLKDKSDVFFVFEMFYKMVQTQFNATIKIFCFDNGGEYMSGNLNACFCEQGIIHQTMCVYTPRQNGVAKRKNRHLLEVTRSLMFDTHVPKSYWGDALLTAIYLINRTPSRVLDSKHPSRCCPTSLYCKRCFSKSFCLCLLCLYSWSY